MDRLIQFLLSENTGKKVGALIGLVVGLSIVLFGFLSTLLIAICMFVGGIIGKSMDDNYSGVDGFKQMFRKKSE
jgi:uncharacterized membrane protein